jgi:hypothetical protein
MSHGLEETRLMEALMFESISNSSIKNNTFMEDRHQKVLKSHQILEMPAISTTDKNTLMKPKIDLQL